MVLPAFYNQDGEEASRRGAYCVGILQGDVEKRKLSADLMVFSNLLLLYIIFSGEE